MNDVDKYTYYITMSLVALFVCIILILVIHFVVGFLCVLSTAGGV